MQTHNRRNNRQDYHNSQIEYVRIAISFDFDKCCEFTHGKTETEEEMNSDHERSSNNNNMMKIK